MISTLLRLKNSHILFHNLLRLDQLMSSGVPWQFKSLHRLKSVTIRFPFWKVT